MSDAPNQLTRGLEDTVERAPFGTVAFVPEVTEADAPSSPIAEVALSEALADVQRLWRRVQRRAPEAVRVQVLEVLAEAEQRLRPAEEGGVGLGTIRERMLLSKQLADLQAELRGRLPWEPTFYREGRLAVVRAQDPVKIQGAIDHARIERFFERYVRQAEAAYERLQYFLEKAGLLSEGEKKELKPWEQPYAQLDHYRELIWGRMKRTP